MAQISVVLPTYNRHSFLERSIQSVLKQTYPDFELIVVDDGSSDKSSDILSTLGSHPKITLLTQFNQGVSQARNRGVEQSRGAFLAFIDSDDEWRPGKLEAQWHYLQSHSEAIVQTSETWIRKGVRVNPPEYLKKQAGDIFLPSLQRCMITPSSVMMTKKLFEESGGFDKNLPACEDYDLWLKITSKHTVGLVPHEYLIRYAGHSDQLSEQYPAMDKFRLASLYKHLQANQFDSQQTVAALEVFTKKLRIYKQGCEKRNKVQELAWCSQLEQFGEKLKTQSVPN